MSFLMNLLILIGFGFVGFLVLWLLNRDEESSGLGKIFIVFFILLAILGFIIWLFVK
jgi:hypothetical protein